MTDINIEQLIKKYGERTFFDGELIGAYFTVAHLESLVNEIRIADAKDVINKTEYYQITAGLKETIMELDK